MQKFVHLHNHSHYSLLDGLTKIEGLVKKTKELGMDAVALTDHGYLYGAIEFYKEAKKQGVKPIIGIETYIAPRKMSDREPNIDDKKYHLVLLAKNNTGYKNLIKITTIANLEGFYYKPRIDRETLRKYSEGVIALSACLSGEIPRAILTREFEKAESLAQEYKDIFGENFYLEISHRPNIKVADTVNKKLIEYSEKFGIPLAATCDSHYLEKDDAQAQDTLVAVQTGPKLGEGDRITMAQDDFSMKSPEEIYATFPYPKVALGNTQKIADMCNVEIELGKIQLPHYDVPADQTPDDFLKNMCLEGVEKRYGTAAKEIMERLEYELSVIKKTGYATYFLIVADFVNWAKNKGILVGPGRGSAAGSIVSYLTNITNIDPLKYDLLFERFLNPERVSMPDIDLDFADTRRDEVLDYVTEKYGQDHVSQIITFGTMAARAAVRDTGRALSIAYEYCDKLAKLIPFGGISLEEALETVAELKEIYESENDAKMIIDAARKLEGVSRHASTHACAVVISKDPLSETVPLQYAAKSQEENRKSDSRKQIVTQFEMGAIENLGLLKMDFLGLKNLSVIERVLDMVFQRHGEKIDIDRLPLDDKKTFRLLQEAKSTGIFQLESAGMKRYLKELKPTELEDIIAMVALYRPGPMELIPDFIARKHGLKKIEYLHPKLEPILKNTYGIGVYQEQMMRIGKDLAGFSLGEVDILRKAIGKKIKELLDEQEEKLVSGMVKNGIDEKTAKKIWDFFPPFAGYAFNRSHAACYGIIGYQTAYLKAHYPAEFMASLMTADLHDIERVAFLVEEAKSMNINVLAPNINESFKDFTVISDKQIRFGLLAIKGVGTNISEAIIAEREQNGKFKSLEDFLTRVSHKDLNKKTIETLIKAGALDEFEERSKLFSNMEKILNFIKDSKQKESPQIDLFSQAGIESKKILKLEPCELLPQRDILAWEKEFVGLYISGHPLSEYKDKLSKATAKIAHLTKNTVGKKLILGGMVSNIKKIMTKKGDPMAFANLEDFSGKIELVIFPQALAKYKELWQDDKIILAEGKLDFRDGAFKLICDSVKALE